jgi:hypothetical protein
MSASSTCIQHSSMHKSMHSMHSSTAACIEACISACIGNEWHEKGCTVQCTGQHIIMHLHRYSFSTAACIGNLRHKSSTDGCVPCSYFYMQSAQHYASLNRSLMALKELHYSKHSAACQRHLHAFSTAACIGN